MTKKNLENNYMVINLIQFLLKASGHIGKTAIKNKLI